MDLVDQPLDAFIQSKKTGRGGRGGRRGGGRGGRGARGVRGGQGRRMSGGGRGFRRQSNRFQQGSGGQMEGKWQHDMYQGGFNGMPQAQTPSRGAGGSKLLISNLDYGVSDDDIMELFREFGRLRKAEVHYDKSGRSMGTAQVMFERHVDALKAVKQYNGVPLDGRPMSIQLMDGTGQTKTFSSTPNKGTVRQRVGVRQQSNGFGSGGGARGRGRGRGGRGGRGRGGRQAPPSVEQLDADLDAYKQSTDSWET